MKENAKGLIWHGLFLGVLCRPFRAQKGCVLFAGVGGFLWMVVEVAVVVAVAAIFLFSHV